MRSTALACARNIFGQRLAVEVVAGKLSLRVECDYDQDPPMPHFCATLIQGSITLAAATLPSRTASSRFSIEPMLLRLTCLGSRNPSIILSVVNSEPLFGVTAIGWSLQHLRLVDLPSRATRPRRTSTSRRRARRSCAPRSPWLLASTARFMMPHSHNAVLIDPALVVKPSRGDGRTPNRT